MSRQTKENLTLFAKIETDNTKCCTNCETTKPLEEFSPDIRGRKGRQSKCKECRNWIKKHHHDPNHKRNYDLQSKYGITINDYDNILEAQGNCCDICSTDTPDGTGRFVVDHCHNTGKMRGIVCSKCNIMLGMARDDTGILKAAIHYLDKQKEN